MDFIIASIIGSFTAVFASYIAFLVSKIFKEKNKINIKVGNKSVNIELSDIEKSVVNVREALSIARENPKIFISYTSADKDLARKIVNDLSAKGIDTWFDEKNINFGDSISKKIEEGMKDSQWFLQIISPQSANSKWIHQELLKMLEIEDKRDRNLIIPIVTNFANVPEELKDRVYVNLDENYEENMSSLIDVIKFKTSNK